MAKKLNSLSDLGLVYSTSNNHGQNHDEKDDDQSQISKQRQKIRIRLESIRGSKLLTRIYGFDENEKTIEDLTKQLKTKCGVGGSFKDGEILVQGNQVLKALDFFIKLGYKDCKKSGG